MASRVILASSNRGKLSELRRLLAPLGLEVAAAGEFDPRLEFPPEEGDSYESNALLKARFCATVFGSPAVADDSGLEVEALDGAPGLYSARFAPDDESRIRRLIAAIRAAGASFPAPARFVCAAAWVEPGGAEMVFRGVLEGHIVEEPRGENGFGFDPVFVPLGFDVTLAEMPAKRKNEISHRGRALGMLVEWLSSRR